MDQTRKKVMRNSTLTGQSILPPDQAPGQAGIVLTRTTVKHALPYDLQLCPNGKVAITNTRKITIYVTKAEVLNTLAREDLDPHRRRLYTAALEEFPKT